MKDYIFKNKYNKLLTPDIVAMLSQIHEFKGQLSRLTNVKSDALTELTEIAKIHSTESSNKIEGIITTDDRLKKIVREKTMPKNRSLPGIETLFQLFMRIMNIFLRSRA